MKFTPLVLFVQDYVSPSKFCSLVSMLSVRDLTHGSLRFFWFLWESQYAPNRPLFWQSLLRCPTSACVDGAPWHLSTAATRSGRYICRQAALPSLPSSFHISISFLQTFCRGEHRSSACVEMTCGNGRPMAAPTIILQITLLVSANRGDLYCNTLLFRLVVI